LRVYASAEGVAQAAAELFVRTSQGAIRKRGRFAVALSGGSTPKRTYELLAKPEFSRSVDWNRVHLFWGDERYVAHDDPSSNFRMTREALLSSIAIPAENIHAVPTELTPPEAAASAYEAEIRRVIGETPTLPRFDLIYLGLGTNGHTASLFPHSPILKEQARLVAADFVAELDRWRISMTFPLLNSSERVAFLVAGADKAQVMRDVLVGPLDPERLPAQSISPRGELLYLADVAAVAELPHTTLLTEAKQTRAS
jgi:6-phosphogluconolactonase